MILHAVSMAAVFVDAVQQAPSAANCVPFAPEPTLRWLLPTIVQTVVSLLSIFAGVLIAVRSFRANKRTEHEQWVRNQEAGHEQWIRDQKKAEWRELLDAINVCQDSLPLVDLLGRNAPVNIDVVQAYEKVRKLQQILFDRLFIDRTKIEPIMLAWVDVNERAKTAMAAQTFEYSVAYNAFVLKVRRLAREDLGIEK